MFVIVVLAFFCLCHCLSARSMFHRNFKVLLCYAAILVTMCIFMASYMLNNIVIDTRSSCEPGIPCVYHDEVHLRVIVLTYNRPQSLLKLLESLEDLELDGDEAAMEIWIDRDKKTGKVDNKTLTVASSFKWSRGLTRVHVQKKHVGIYGQWIDTWRPRLSNDVGYFGISKELALFVEDDLIVSKFAYRWLRAVHNAYGDRSDYGGASIQTDELLTQPEVGKRYTLFGPRKDTTFMYKAVSPWGFSPQPRVWHEFQDWFHRHRNDRRPEFRPYVPQVLSTVWYKKFEKSGTTDSMWTMWFLYYIFTEQLYIVHSNLAVYTRRKDTCLSINRREIGLHYYQKGPENLCKLLTYWRSEFITFPKLTTKVHFNGSFVIGGTY